MIINAVQFQCAIFNFEVLKVDLDTGESETSVIDGLCDKGYKVNILYKDSKMASLIISSE